MDSNKISKQLRLAAWSPIIMFVLSFILVFLIFFLILFYESFWPISLLALIVPFQILFNYGYVLIGKIYKSKLITVASWYKVITNTIGLLLAIFIMIYITNGYSISGGEISSIEESVKCLASQDYSIVYIVLTAIFFIANIVMEILLAYGIFKLKDKLKYSKPTGILGMSVYIILLLSILLLLFSFLLGQPLLIIGVNLFSYLSNFVSLAYMIFLIIILFDQSHKQKILK